MEQIERISRLEAQMENIIKEQENMGEDVKKALSFQNRLIGALLILQPLIQTLVHYMLK